MTLSLATLLRDRYDEVLSAILESSRVMNATHGFSIQEDEMRRRTRATLSAFIQEFSGDPPTAFADFWQEVSYARFRAGVPLENMQIVLTMITTSIRRWLKDTLAGDPDAQLGAIEQCVTTGESAQLRLHSAYRSAREDVIQAQQADIRRLSTPIIPVYTGVLVVPLIGDIDAAHAGDMIERLLEGITRARASAVLIDLTGVPVVDDSVADHLLRAARASELLGAKVIFVGIGAQTAQALVRLGNGLRGLLTLADLQAGFEHALRVRGLSIGPRPRPAARPATC